mgnify:CR=1 FL=1
MLLPHYKLRLPYQINAQIICISLTRSFSFCAEEVSYVYNMQCVTNKKLN